MGLGDLVQKAVYLGIGVATYAGEKAGERLGELREQMQKMADEMVEKGEMTAEEGRKFVDDMVRKAQQAAPGATAGSAADSTPSTATTAPRPIEILDETETATNVSSAPASSTPVSPTSEAPPSDKGTSASEEIDIDTMRRQVQELQEELRRLRRG